MKVAFHFNADYHGLLESGNYSLPIYQAVFGSITQLLPIESTSKIEIGDLRLHSLTMDVVEQFNLKCSKHNQEKFIDAVSLTFFPPFDTWSSVSSERAQLMTQNNVFVMCFEELTAPRSRNIDSHLQNQPWYLGALQVNDQWPIHRFAYSGSLNEKFRIVDSDINVFWDGWDEESKDEWLVEQLGTMGFQRVNHEALLDFPSGLTADQIMSLFS